MALRYLDELGVTPHKVAALVVTHFHSDHYRGIDRLFDTCSSARLMATEALQTATFEQLYADDQADPLLGMIPNVIRRARKRALPGGLARISSVEGRHVSSRQRC